MTQEGVFELSDQTRRVLESLEQPVHALVFVTASDPQGARLQNLLDEYNAVSDGEFTFSVTDPERSPVQAQQYNIYRSGSIVFQQDNREELVVGTTETDITRGLIRVTRTEERVVAFSIGHGEIGYGEGDGYDYTFLTSVLRDQGYAVRTIALATESLENIDVFVLAGATAPLTQEELQKVIDYQRSGGSVLFAIDPSVESGWDAEIGNDWLLQNGIVHQNGFIVDPAQSIIGEDPPLSPYILEWTLHGITEGLESGFMSGVSRIDSSSDNIEGRRVTVLARSSEASWLETSANTQDAQEERALSIERDEQDTYGPIGLAAVSEGIDMESISSLPSDAQERALEQSKWGRIVVFGDSHFAVDVLLRQNIFNQDLFVNAVDWLAQEEDLLGIRPRSLEERRVSMSASQQRSVQWWILVVLPLLPLVSGAAVWYHQRRRARGL